MQTFIELGMMGSFIVVLLFFACLSAWVFYVTNFFHSAFQLMCLTESMLAGKKECFFTLFIPVLNGQARPLMKSISPLPSPC